MRAPTEAASLVDVYTRAAPDMYLPTASGPSDTKGNTHRMTLLLLQMSIVLLVTLICGYVARKLGQTRVVGEIIGGILIGPSVLGRYFPDVAHIFMPHSFAAFENLSTVGL